MRVVIALALGLAACGRVGFDARPLAGDGADGPIAGLAIVAPKSALPASSIQLAAQLDGVPTTAVTWSTSAGAIDASGAFDAPDTDDLTATATITATLVADPTTTATVTIAIARTVAPAPVATVGATTSATGYAHQRHFFHEGDEWWTAFFTAGDTTHLQTAHSSDLVHWTVAASLALPVAHANDGRDIALADAVIAGVHVVHFSIGGAGRTRFHVRAVVSPGQIAFGTLAMQNMGGVKDPDGPAVAILDNHVVVDGTGWDATPQTPPLSPCGDGDVESFESTTADMGAPGDAPLTFSRRVIWCTPDRVNQRAMVVDGSQLYEFTDDGNDATYPMNLHVNVRTAAGVWLPDESGGTAVEPPKAFATDGQFPIDDFDVVAQGGQIHALRRAGLGNNSPLEHRVTTLPSDGTTWSDAPAPPAINAPPGTGLVLRPYGLGMVAMQLDLNGRVMFSVFRHGAWSAWRTFDGQTAAARADLTSGGTGGAPTVPAVVAYVDTAAQQIEVFALP